LDLPERLFVFGKGNFAAEVLQDSMNNLELHGKDQSPQHLQRQLCISVKYVSSIQLGANTRYKKYSNETTASSYPVLRLAE